METATQQQQQQQQQQQLTSYSNIFSKLPNTFHTYSLWLDLCCEAANTYSSLLPKQQQRQLNLLIYRVAREREKERRQS